MLRQIVLAIAMTALATQALALNPQPEPPNRHGAKVLVTQPQTAERRSEKHQAKPGEKRELNPQPLPPGAKQPMVTGSQGRQ